jgi:thiamine pyrophosphokinase
MDPTRSTDTAEATVPPPLHALVLADGDRPRRAALDAAWPRWDDQIALIVAADGGARLATELGLRPHRWVGDGDSIAAEDLADLAARGVEIIHARRNKDESDGELALLEALAAGAGRITVLGALGGRRVDHLLANVALLAHPGLIGVPTALLDEATRVTLVDARTEPARRDLTGRIGDLVSLLPWGGDVEAVRTHGLQYPLRDEPLVAGPARGLSNVRLAGDPWIEVRGGRLLVVESPATLAP